MSVRANSSHELAPTAPLDPAVTAPMEPLGPAMPAQPETAEAIDREINERNLALRGLVGELAAKRLRDGGIRTTQPRRGASPNHFRGKDASEYVHDDVTSLQNNLMNGLRVVGGSWQDDGTWANPRARIKAQAELAEATKGGVDERGKRKPAIINGTLEYDEKYNKLVRPAEGGPSVFRVTDYKKAKVAKYNLGTAPNTQTYKETSSPAVYTLERSFRDNEGKLRTETIKVGEKTLAVMLNSRLKAKEDPQGVTDTTIAGRKRIYHRRKTEAEAMAERQRLEAVAQEKFITDARPGLINVLQDLRETGDAVALDAKTAEAYFEDSKDEKLRKKQASYAVNALARGRAIDKEGKVVASAQVLHNMQMELLAVALNNEENLVGATYQKDDTSPRITITGQTRDSEGVMLYEVQGEEIRDGKLIEGKHTVTKKRLANFLDINFGT